MLEKFNFIRSKRIKNKIIYFDYEIDPKFDKTLFTLKDPRYFKILENILLEPHITVKDLAKKVRINSEKVKKVILALIELNFVNKKSNDKSTEYYCKLKNIIPILKILKFPESKIVKYYGY
ncbi:MAG: winged helix-turn-helix transcriptional regulator [Candidatus Hodarchaeota archaeon]